MNYGVTPGDLFEAPDLFERKNIPQVTKAIYSLGRAVSIIFQDFQNSEFVLVVCFEYADI